MMKEEHIKVIISLLEKFGRDPKVLDILCNLCVGSGVAVRSSQNNITDFLLPGNKDHSKNVQIFVSESTFHPYHTSDTPLHQTLKLIGNQKVTNNCQIRNWIKCPSI